MASFGRLSAILFSVLLLSCSSQDSPVPGSESDAAVDGNDGSPPPRLDAAIDARDAVDASVDRGDASIDGPVTDRSDAADAPRPADDTDALDAPNVDVSDAPKPPVNQPDASDAPPPPMMREASDDALDGYTPPVARAPTVTSLSPTDVLLGGEVTVTGTDFLPNPRVRLNTVAVVPTAVSATQLKFVVPSDFPLSSCSASVMVRIDNDAGSAAPATLDVRSPGPHVDPLSSAGVPAGALLQLTGTGLGGASVALDGVAITAQGSSVTTLSLVVPRATSAGHHTLTVQGACGNVDVDTLVLAPAPIIVDTDLATVAANGILNVTADVSNGATISSVSVGSQMVLPTDPNAFRWLNQNDPTHSTFALRIPSGVTAGTLDLRLGGPTGSSQARSLSIISIATLSPPAPAGIVLVPPVADDDPFPVSTRSPFPQVPMGSMETDSNNYFWVYPLNFTDNGINSDTNICVGEGTIQGFEKHCPNPALDSNCPVSPNCDTTEDACHTLSGTYRLSSSSNQVDIFIQRDPLPSAGEHYVGGWAQADDSAPVSTVTTEYLVLRSLRTGIQLTIRHLFDPSGQSCTPATLASH